MSDDANGFVSAIPLESPVALKKNAQVAKDVKDVQEAIGGKGAYGASVKPEAVMKSRLVTQRFGYGKVEKQNPAKFSVWQKIKMWFARLFQGE